MLSMWNASLRGKLLLSVQLLRDLESLLCRSDDFINMGECSQHAESCSEIGLFLILKMSSVLVLRPGKHAFWGSPYLVCIFKNN